MGSESTYSAAEAIAKFSSFLFLLQSVMTLNFKPLGVSDEESGQIGFLVCIVCAIGGKSLTLYCTCSELALYLVLSVSVANFECLHILSTDISRM